MGMSSLFDILGRVSVTSHKEYQTFELKDTGCLERVTNAWKSFFRPPLPTAIVPEPRENWCEKLHKYMLEYYTNGTPTIVMPEPQVKEVGGWFDAIWQKLGLSTPPTIDDASAGSAIPRKTDLSIQTNPKPEVYGEFSSWGGDGNPTRTRATNYRTFDGSIGEKAPEPGCCKRMIKAVRTTVETATGCKGIVGRRLAGKSVDYRRRLMSRLVRAEKEMSRQ